MKKQDRRLSVVLAVHNEEASLKACLEAVALIADEIVIVDGESSDRTVDIARSFSARVISTTNKPNFHINKQMAVDAAKGDLILQLDADEIVDIELFDYIKTLKQGSTSLAYQAWYIQRKNYFLNRWLSKGGQYPDPLIRLFQRDRAHLPMQSVHEQMVVDGETGTADGHLLHYGNPTLAVYLNKHNTYTSFTAQNLFAAGQTVSFAFLFSMWLSKPLLTFFLIYLRHRGYVDGLPGFIFALLSAFHHPIASLKLWELYEHRN